ncbi:type II secretion system protein [Patescibacteria group bacterium]
MNKKGFTLIELLVVIAILGILASLLLANMAGSRGRARDATRKSDLKQFQKAAELYRQDHATEGYPPNIAVATLTGYMSGPLLDPINTGEYTYTYDRDGDGDTYTYSIFACLENGSDPDQDVAPNAACTTSGASYTLTQP